MMICLLIIQALYLTCAALTLVLYIRVIHHLFKQAQNETAILNVFQDLKSKISEKSDQN